VAMVWLLVLLMERVCLVSIPRVLLNEEQETHLAWGGHFYYEGFVIKKGLRVKKLGLRIYYLCLKY
jgi:hypothetical protein